MSLSSKVNYSLEALSGITVGNINITGNIFQNNNPYIASQWTSTSGNTLSYTSGNVVISNGSLLVSSLTTGNINFTGTLSQNGSPYIGSQWTGTSGTLYYGTAGSSQVGINTTAPNATLDVVGTGRISTSLTTGSLFSTNQTTTNVVATRISASNINVSGTLTVVNITATNLIDTTISAGTLVGTSVSVSNLSASSSTLANSFISGGLGIGTTNSNTSYNLDVAGSIRSGLHLDIGGSQPIYNGNTLGKLFITGVQNSFTSGANVIITTSQDTFPTYNFLTYGHDASWTMYDMYYDGAFRNSSTSTAFMIVKESSTLRWNYNTSGFSAGATAPVSTSICIGSGGNVGLGGQVTPAYTLDVSGGARIITGITAGSSRFTSISSGNSQFTGLSAGNINFTGNLFQNGSPYIGSQWVGTSGNIYFGTAGSSQVGINTTSPGTTLDVTGTGRITTSLTTGALYSTNQTTTNIVSTNLTVSNVKVIGSTTSVNSSTASVVLQGGLSINEPTNATSVSNGGALTIAGGAAIEGDLIVGGSILYSNAQASSSTFSYLTLTATDWSTDIANGALVSFGGISVQNTANAFSATEGNGLTIAGGAGIGADLYVGGKGYVPNLVSTNISASNINVSGTLTVVNITSTNLVDTTISAGTIVGTTTSVANIYASLGTVSNLVGTNLSSSNLRSTVATIPNIIHTNITTTSIISTNQTTTNIVVTAISSGTLVGTTVSSANLVGSSLSVGNSYISGALNTYDTVTINKSGVGAELLALVFNTERAWVVKQTGSGASTNLVLQSQVNAKNFLIQSHTGSNIAQFYDGGSDGILYTSMGNIYAGIITTGTLLNTNMISSNITATNILITGGNLNATNVTIGSSTSAPIVDIAPNLTTTSAQLGLRTTDGNITTSIYSAFFSNRQTSLIENVRGSGQIVIRTTNPFTTQLAMSTYGVQYSIAGTTHMVITSAGNVGIGTTSPDSSLHVAGTIVGGPIGSGIHMGIDSSNVSIIHLNSGNSTSGQSMIDFGFTGNNYQSKIMHTNSTKSLGFRVNGNSTDSLTIASTGNVGIGITTPVFTLDVNGTIDASTYITSAALYSTNQTTTNIVATASTITNLNIPGTLTVVNITSTNLVETNITAATIIVTGGSLNATFNSNTIGNIFTTGGNLGIGTTSPAARLHISGGNLITNGGNTTTRIVLHNSTTGTSTTSDGLQLVQDGINAYLINYEPNQRLYLANNNSVYMTITSNGNIGIGTTSPRYTLDVSDSTNLSNSLFLNNRNSTVQYFSFTSNTTQRITIPQTKGHNFETVQLKLSIIMNASNGSGLENHLIDAYSSAWNTLEPFQIINKMSTPKDLSSLRMVYDATGITTANIIIDIDPQDGFTDTNIAKLKVELIGRYGTWGEGTLSTLGTAITTSNTYATSFVQMNNATVSTGSLISNNVSLSGISSFFAGSFSANNDVSSASNVTGLLFPSATVRSFVATLTVNLNKAGGNLNEMVTLEGVQRDSGWVLFDSSLGESTGLVFTITSGGQVQYTSTNYVGWVSTTIRFEGHYYTLAGTYTPVTLPTSGNVSITGDLSIASTNNATNTSSGALTVSGGAGISKSLLVGENFNVGGVSNTFTGSFGAANNVAAAANVTGFLVPTATFSSFTASVNVRMLTTTTILNAQYLFEATQTTSGWLLNDTSMGDSVGITFTITSTGQIQYTSTNIANWQATTINYSVTAISISTGFTAVLPTSGSVAISGNLTIDNTTDSSSTSSASLVLAGGVGINKSLLVGGNFNIGGVTTQFAGTFSAANGASGASVTGLLFPNETIRSFTCTLSVRVVSSINYNTQHTIEGIQTATGGWQINDYQIGDASGIVFNINSSGQITYTSPTFVTWTSTTMHFNAIVYNISSSYTPIPMPTGGSSSVAGSLVIQGTDEASSTNSGALSISGGVNIQKNLIVNNTFFINTSGNVGIHTSTPGSYRLNVNGIINAGRELHVTGFTTTAGPMIRFLSNDGVIRGLIGNTGTTGAFINGSQQHDFCIRSELRPILITTNFNRSTPDMYIDSAGLVGIKTTSPTYNLDVNGTFDVSNANGLMLFASSGNLGIGTTSPSNILDIVTNGDNSLGMRLTNNHTGGNSRINFNMNVGFASSGNAGQIYASVSDPTFTMRSYSGNTSGIALLTGGAAPIKLSTSNTERMRIDTRGNVGIGTSDPISNLHTLNTGNSGGVLMLSRYITATNGGNLTHGEIQFRSTRVTFGSAKISSTSQAVDGLSGWDDAGRLEFHTSAGGGEGGTRQRMVISERGNIGINTTAPSTLLEINATTSNLTSGSFRITSVGNTTASGLQATGNIHITNPLSTSHLYYGITGTGVDSVSGTGSNNPQVGLLFSGNATQGTYIHLLTTNAYATGAQQRLTIRPDGNVGIGTTNPAASLDLGISSSSKKLALSIQTTNFWGFGANNSSIEYQAPANSEHRFYIGSTTSGLGTEHMRIATNGNIGIGTTSPSHKLDIVGSIRGITGTSSNILINSDGPAGWGNIEMFGSSGAYIDFKNISGDDFDSRIKFLGSNNSLGFLMNLGESTGMSLTSTGTLLISGDIGAFASISDRTLKTNITDISPDSALDTIKTLRPVTFNWKDDIFNIERRGEFDSGFIAQEVAEVIPHAVGTYNTIDHQNTYKNMRHERIIPYLVGAIQKLEETVSKLTEKINLLESK